MKGYTIQHYWQVYHEILTLLLKNKLSIKQSFTTFPAENMKLKKGKSDDTKSGFYQTCNKFQNVKDIVEFQLIFIKLYG